MTSCKILGTQRFLTKKVLYEGLEPPIGLREIKLLQL